MSKSNEINKNHQELPISSIVEALFQGTDDIRHFIVSVMEPILLGQLNLTDRQLAIVGSYYRIVGWLKVLRELNSPAHYQAVSSSARSIFELMLDIKLIHSDTSDNLVKKFHAFPEIEKYRAAKNLVSYCEKTNNNKIQYSNQKKFIDGDEKSIAIESLVIKLWGTNSKGKPNWPKHWSGKNIYERANDLGPDVKDLYMEFYPFLSWHIHSGSTGYAGMPKETLEAAFGLMHGMIQKVVIDTTEICAKEMKIDKIDNLEKPFNEMISDLRKKTVEIISQKQTRFINN